MEQNKAQEKRVWDKFRVEFWVGIMLNSIWFLYDIYSNDGDFSVIASIDWMKGAVVVALFIIGFVLVRLIKNMINAQVENLINKNQSSLTNRLDKLERKIPENLSRNIESFLKQEEFNSELKKIERLESKLEKQKEKQEQFQNDRLIQSKVNKIISDCLADIDHPRLKNFLISNGDEFQKFITRTNKQDITPNDASKIMDRFNNPPQRKFHQPTETDNA